MVVASSSNAVSDQDGANFALTLQLLDQKLETFRQQTGREVEISIATAGGADKLANLNLEGIDPYVDFYNVMTYDFHGGLGVADRSPGRHDRRCGGL